MKNETPHILGPSVAGGGPAHTHDQPIKTLYLCENICIMTVYIGSFKKLFKDAISELPEQYPQ
jgi:hypothetical protein